VEPAELERRSRGSGPLPGERGSNSPTSGSRSSGGGGEPRRTLMPMESSGNPAAHANRVHSPPSTGRCGSSDNLELITTVGPAPRTVRFDANLENHHHYVCVKWRLTMDFRERRARGPLRIPRGRQEVSEASPACTSRCACTCETCRKRHAKAAHSGAESQGGQESQRSPP